MTIIQSLQKLFSSSLSEAQLEITRLFELYKPSFIAYLLKNHALDEDTVEDIYQESFIILYKHIQTGKLKELKTATLKSYLFGIGKNKALAHFERRKKQDQVNITELSVFLDTNDSEEWIAKQETVRKVVQEMGDPCKQVLSLYYWEQKKMQEIAEIMKYKNSQVAKNKKHNCAQKLKTTLIQIFRKEGLI